MARIRYKKQKNSRAFKFFRKAEYKYFIGPYSDHRKTETKIIVI